VSRVTEESPPPLLLFADNDRRQEIVGWIERPPRLGRVLTDPEQVTGAVRLILWSLAVPAEPTALETELHRLRQRWPGTPLLLLLPSGHRYLTPFLMGLPVEGLVEAPGADELRQGITTLLEGGRVVAIGAADGRRREPSTVPTLGLGQWLLISGLQQIDAELALLRDLLEPPPAALLPLLVLQGRRRELRAARALLVWLWGPLSMAWSEPGHGTGGMEPEPVADPQGSTGVSITLSRRDAEGVWNALEERLRRASLTPPVNRSSQLLAFEGLLPERRRDLLLALLDQFAQLRGHLATNGFSGEQLATLWNDRQIELRQEALRRLAGSYVQLPWQGALRPVAETLLSDSDLRGEDPELPDPLQMLAPLVQARPLLVDGRLLAPDDPRALLYLELLLSNWLVRSAERISAEVLACCAAWPELRRYLLRPELLVTRNLERLRNQLNAHQRWLSWFERPIELYESRRPLFRLEPGAIQTVELTEPRDRELAQQGWLQQAVTLALEARDAIAPQLQSLARAVGNLLVLVLTRVVGRAIGLVGRGIAQGMGRG
jgi:hypothetical protein